MSDRHDIEETLRRFRHEPDSRAKDAMMAAFNATLERPRVPLWRRPVPLYAAAAVLVVMVGLSFVAGKRTSMSAGGAVAPGQPTDGAVTSFEVEWSSAGNDLL